MTELLLIVGLAFLAGLAVGLIALANYVDASPSPEDHDRLLMQLQRLNTQHKITKIEAETQRRMYDAALRSAKRGR